MGAEESKLSNGGAEGGANDFVHFYINGQLHQVRGDDKKWGPTSRLVDFIREEVQLTGTKFMCREGGCGACIVTVKYPRPSDGTPVTISANSCLTPVLSCDGWNIYTVESLGNKKKGYSKIQEQLIKYGGTQCGFCTPGMIMTMNSSLEEKEAPAQDIEELLDGNICRCTGYRPIIDAFKSLTTDGDSEVEPGKCNSFSNNAVEKLQSPSKSTDEVQVLPDEPLPADIRLKFQTSEEWITPTSVQKAFVAVQHFNSAGMNYTFVAGNTGTGVFKNQGPYQGFIDIRNIPELAVESLDSNGITLGAGLTLSQVIEFLQRLSKENRQGFEFALPMAKHILRVANTSVRNVGTLAGNLMLKHYHNEFPSDPFLLLTTLNATLTIMSASSQPEKIAVENLLNFDMKDKIIVSADIPIADPGHKFRSFKITRRYQNAHPDVNAGFSLNLSQDGKFTVTKKPNIVFGGINASFIHASKTEAFLEGKSLKDVSTLSGLMAALSQEIQPSFTPPDASVEYRKGLTQSLLYKTVLGILGSNASSQNRSGAKKIKRGNTKGRQVYDTDKDLWPLNKPVAKLEAVAQCTGEAVYISDIPTQPKELFGAFVLSTVGKAEILSMDATEALRIPGVVAFLQAKDVPGPNNFMVYQDPEEIFCSGKVMYAGQSLGMIVAETRAKAFEAIKSVRVSYKNIQPPSLEPVLPEGSTFDERWRKCTQLYDLVSGPKGEKIEEPTSVVEGEFRFGAQYHFHMETQVCLCVPEEDHLKVFTATQWIDHTQAAISSALGIPSNEIRIEVKRIGGAYGSKICRASHIATASAVASQATGRPVRVFLDLQTNMEMIGKRSPYIVQYKISVNDKGRILGLKAAVFAEVGSVINDADIDDAIKFMQSCYDVTGWEVTKAQLTTDKAPNTFCRAPGTSQGIAMVEQLMEHLAFQLGKDPTELREANFIHDGSPLLVPYSETEKTFVGENKLWKMITRMKKAANYDSRKQLISNFNKANRWKKQGLSLVPMRYHLDFQGYKYPTYVAIYKYDGSVVVTHGGIEMGQGINTKVAQTVAYMFKIPVDKIRITATNNIIGANSDLSGASVTSELCCYAATVACQKLIDRMKPVKDQMKDPTWEQLIAACGRLAMDLTASHLYTSDDPVKTYDIWGLTLAEVEIDCLTGEYKINRVDLTEDAGRSLNPEVDIGQIEGAFMMAIGWWTSENLVYDSATGKLLTNGTWEYKPPTAADVPVDLRITLLRKSPNPFGVLRSKATGEPPLCMGISVFFALRNAIYAAREASGNTKFVQINGPLTQEKIYTYCLSSADQFSL